MHFNIPPKGNPVLDTHNEDSPTIEAPTDTETLYWRDLTSEEKERYYPTEDPEQAKHYFRFNNRPYYLPNFMRINPEKNPEFEGWTGAYFDTMHSGTLLRIGEEDNVIVTTYKY